MKTYINLIFKLAFLISTVLTIYCSLNLFLYNEFGEIFFFEKANGSILCINNIDDDAVIITYEFQIENEVFQNSIKLKNTIFETKIEEQELQVIYNNKFPSVNFINGVKLTNGYYIGLVFGVIWILLTSSFFIHADREKWASKYRKIFKN